MFYCTNSLRKAYCRKKNKWMENCTGYSSLQLSFIIVYKEWQGQTIDFVETKRKKNIFSLFLKIFMSSPTDQIKARRLIYQFNSLKLRSSVQHMPNKSKSLFYHLFTRKLNEIHTATHPRCSQTNITAWWNPIYKQ